MPETFVFYAFSAVAIGASTLVIGQRKGGRHAPDRGHCLGADPGMDVVGDERRADAAEIALAAGGQ